MDSIFKFKNKVQRAKFKEIVEILFPEYKYVSIQKSGIITFKKYWFSFGKSIHISELCFTEIINRLSVFRQGNNEYSCVYKWFIEQIIQYKMFNIIDWLYSEFLKIKKKTKFNIVIDNNSFPLRSSTCETIGTIIHQENKIKDKPIYHIKSKKIKTLQKLYESFQKDSFINLEKSKFLLAWK